MRSLPGQSAGLSLVELLVSLTLAVSLVAAMLLVYVERKQHARILEQRARMQQNARFALAIVGRELELAGFLAAETALPLAPQAPGADCAPGDNWALETAPGLDFADNLGVYPPRTLSGATLACLGRDLVAGSDLLAIKRSATVPAISNGRVHSSAVLAGPQWYLRLHAAQGQAAHYFQQAESPLPAADIRSGSGVDYWPWKVSVFYLRDHMVTGDGVPTLCVERLSGRELGPLECLVPGVEDLQVGFGLDHDGDGRVDSYSYAPEASDLVRARVARVHVLMRSVERLPGQTGHREYRLGPKRVRPEADGYLRAHFERTVSLFNVEGLSP